MFRYGARSQQLPTNIMASCPSFKQITPLEDGTCKEILVPANKPLPSADALKIKNVIDAGLPLEQVNSKVLQPDFGIFADSEFVQDYLEKDGINE